MPKRINQTITNSELFIGLVGAIGTDLELLSTALCESLQDVRYTCEAIRLSEILHQIDKYKGLPDSPEDIRCSRHMDAGNDFRKRMRRGGALAVLAIGAIRECRERLTGDPNTPISRRAYIFRSLKHPEEVRTLREIYGSSFFLVAAYSPRETRKQNLAGRIADSYNAFQTDQYLAHAESLIKRDESEVGKKFGQNVRDTFPMADVFVDVNEKPKFSERVSRFTELIFRNTFHTPTHDEYGMYHAQAAALRSAALGRQVGAAITTKDGNIIAVGTNEVPKAEGGQYWENDVPDHRDFKLGYDTSDRMRRKLLADILRRLSKGGWLHDRKRKREINELVKELLDKGSSPLMKEAQFMNMLIALAPKTFYN